MKQSFLKKNLYQNPNRLPGGKKQNNPIVSQILIKNKVRNSILAHVDNLAPLPHIVSKILCLINDNNSTANSFEELFRQDPALTARLLKLANSSYYGLRNKVNSISHAIVMLGYKTLKNLVLAASLNKLVKGEFPGYGFKNNGLWHHSFLTATWAEKLAGTLGWEKQQSQEIFVSGLLHDIGKLIMSSYVNRDLKKMLVTLIENDGNLIYAEQNLVGIDHAEIGACVAEKWNFAPELVFIIQNHHNHLDTEEQNTKTALLHLTDYLINQDHIGMFDNFPITSTLNSSCLEILKIKYDIIPEFKEKIIQSFEEI